MDWGGGVTVVESKINEIINLFFICKVDSLRRKFSFKAKPFHNSDVSIRASDTSNSNFLTF